MPLSRVKLIVVFFFRHLKLMFFFLSHGYLRFDSKFSSRNAALIILTLRSRLLISSHCSRIILQLALSNLARLSYFKFILSVVSGSLFISSFFLSSILLIFSYLFLFYFFIVFYQFNYLTLNSVPLCHRHGCFLLSYFLIVLLHFNSLLPAKSPFITLIFSSTGISFFLMCLLLLFYCNKSLFFSLPISVSIYIHLTGVPLVPEVASYYFYVRAVIFLFPCRLVLIFHLSPSCILSVHYTFVIFLLSSRLLWYWPLSHFYNTLFSLVWNFQQNLAWYFPYLARAEDFYPSLSFGRCYSHIVPSLIPLFCFYIIIIRSQVLIIGSWSCTWFVLRLFSFSSL